MHSNLGVRVEIATEQSQRNTAVCNDPKCPDHVGRLEERRAEPFLRQHLGLGSHIQQFDDRILFGAASRYPYSDPHVPDDDDTSAEMLALAYLGSADMLDPVCGAYEIGSGIQVRHALPEGVV